MPGRHHLAYILLHQLVFFLSYWYHKFDLFKIVSSFFLSVSAGFFYFFHGSSQFEFDPNARTVTHTLKSNSWLMCWLSWGDMYKHWKMSPAISHLILCVRMINYSCVFCGSRRWVQKMPFLDSITWTPALALELHCTGVKIAHCSWGEAASPRVLYCLIKSFIFGPFLASWSNSCSEH